MSRVYHAPYPEFGGQLIPLNILKFILVLLVVYPYCNFVCFRMACFGTAVSLLMFPVYGLVKVHASIDKELRFNEESMNARRDLLSSL